MSFFHALLSQPATGPTSFLVGAGGDSNGDGRGTVIPTVSADTLYLSDGLSLTEITTQSVANDGGGVYGSIWQQMATRIKTESGLSLILCNGCAGGSEFYPNGDNNNWYTSGTLYSAFKTKLDATKVLAGNIPISAIIWNLGINDLRSANTLANIYLGVDSLISRLKTDYPGVPLWFILPGRAEAEINTQRFYDLRFYLVNKARNDADIYIVGNAAFFVGVTGGYQVDNLHYSDSTNTQLGNILGQFLFNSTVTDKWARLVVSFQYTVLNENRRSLLVDFIESEVAVGNWSLLQMLYLFRVGDERDVIFDLTGLGYAVTSNFGYVANDYCSTGGTASGTWFTPSFIPSVYSGAGLTGEDVIAGVKLVQNNQPGTAGVMFGRADASGNNFRIGQSTTNVNYYVNVGSGSGRTVAAEASLANDSWHSIERIAGNESYYKDSALIDTVGTAFLGACSQAVTLGRYLNNSTSSLGFSGRYHGMYAAKADGFDLATFITDIEYLIDHWND